MAKLSSVKSNVKKSEEGIWTPFESGIEFLIARMGNPKYTKLLAKLSRPHHRKLRGSRGASSDLENDLTKQAVAKTVLVGWRNLDDEDGNPIPYSQEKALEIISDPAYIEVYNFVLATAGDFQAFREEDQAESLGNSSEASSGK